METIRIMSGFSPPGLGEMVWDIQTDGPIPCPVLARLDASTDADGRHCVPIKSFIAAASVDLRESFLGNRAARSRGAQ